METLLAVVVGGLYAAGIYMMMRRSIVKLVVGLILLGHGANLLIFTVGRITRGAPPLIDLDAGALVGTYADPLPQALILTAIVIGFGLQAFLVVLVKRVYQRTGTDDVNRMTTTELLEGGKA